MFRREIEGTVHRFVNVGLWGSGNVVSERALFYEGTATAYSMWDGHALFGPGRPGGLERYPSLLGIVSLATFLDRFADLGPDCLVWSGEEVLGVGCAEACTNLAAVCADAPCPCENWPRATSDCVAAASSCEDLALCGTDP